MWERQIAERWMVLALWSTYLHYIFLHSFSSSPFSDYRWCKQFLFPLNIASSYTPLGSRLEGGRNCNFSHQRDPVSKVEANWGRDNYCGPNNKTVGWHLQLEQKQQSRIFKRLWGFRELLFLTLCCRWIERGLEADGSCCYEGDKNRN